MSSSSAGRLLLVGGGPQTSALLRRTAAEWAPDCAVIRAPTADAARHALSEDLVACILVAADDPQLDELLRHPHGAPVVCLVDRRAPTLGLLQRGVLHCVTADEDAVVDLGCAMRNAVALHTAQRALHEREQLEAAKRDLVAVGHFELDADLMPVYVSDACHDLSGMVQDEPDSFKRALTEVHPDDLSATYAALDDLKAGRKVAHEYRRVPGDGEVSVLEVRGVQVRDDRNRVIGYVGRILDLTERRRVEHRDRASRAQLQAIFEHSPSAMWFKDTESNYLFANRLFGEQFGRHPDTVGGLTDFDLLPQAEAATVRGRDRAVLAGGRPLAFEDPLRTPSGTRLFAAVLFPVFDADGEAIGICGLADDVTERRRSEDRFRRSFDDAPVPMTMARPDGTLMAVNRAMTELVGYEAGAMLDRRMSEFTHPDDLAEDERSTQDLHDGGDVMVREKRVVRRDGDVVWVLSTVNLVRDVRGRPIWALAHVLDITKRKDAEHELQRQQVDMHTIARVARDAGSSERPADEVCRAAAQITGASAVGLLELRGSDRLVLTAAAREGAPVGLEIKIPDNPVGGALCAASKERLFVADAGQAVRPSIVADARMASVVFEPIMRGTEVLGVMTIAWPTPREGLTARESSVISLLAAELGTIVERSRLTTQLRELARTDPLTGLPNRRVWDERLAIELSHARRIGHPVCVALVDLDHFKLYNDTHGHQAGDRLLSGATAAWGAQLRGGDLLARVGGDEFAVLLPECDLPGGQALIERLRMATPNGVSCSVGIVQWDGKEPTDVAIARADAALYAAKESGRARSVAG